MHFDWDPAKEDKNLTKHHISFVAAARVLERGDAWVYPSPRENEARWVAVGPHPETRVMVAVVYTIRGDVHRIISARRARTDEEKAYREAGR